MRKLTRLCIHHRLVTIAAWVLLLVGLIGCIVGLKFVH